MTCKPAVCCATVVRQRAHVCSVAAPAALCAVRNAIGDASPRSIPQMGGSAILALLVRLAVPPIAAMTDAMGLKHSGAGCVAAMSSKRHWGCTSLEGVYHHGESSICLCGAAAASAHRGGRRAARCAAEPTLPFRHHTRAVRAVL
eukprot:TRINITY_DN4851_c0_g1_i4.p1 TRINITY_DN4851_c0_g1~~TRINITY_DN4851_c0_g1_i4.p1  ORF type:complete len:145 (+),score=12.39 TRINITY_DN4851_c0_g1_i4:206-640(+)